MTATQKLKLEIVEQIGTQKKKTLQRMSLEKKRVEMAGKAEDEEHEIFYRRPI